MKNFFSAALVLQVILASLFVVHRWVRALGSDVMFGVLLLALMVGIFLLWQSFANASLNATQKGLGLAVGLLPAAWLVWFGLFLRG
jgi:hypothetical protein